MLSDVMSGAGLKSTLVADGDPQGLKADMLLLIGECHSFERFAKLLIKCKEHRPKTILLQIDPFPPPNISRRVEEIGTEAMLRISKWRKSWHIKILKAFLTRTLRQKLNKKAYVKIFRDFRQEAEKSMQKTFEHFDDEAYKFIMQGYVGLKNPSRSDWLDCIICTTRMRKEFLITRGIAAHYVPLGYHPLIGHDLGLKRDISVLFIGSMNRKRRQLILSRISEALASRRINLKAVTNIRFGSERTKLLNQALISLNVSQFPWEPGGLRFLMSMACGALVVSEPIEDSAPYKPGVHFVQAEISELPDVIQHYLERDDERKTIVDSAYKFVTEQLTLERTLFQILEKCNANPAISSCSLSRGD
jgi:glycosyltransferase involved in cell wall biosynthesis